MYLHLYVYCTVIPGLISDFYLTRFDKYMSVSKETPEVSVVLINLPYIYVDVDKNIETCLPPSPNMT